MRAHTAPDVSLVMLSRDRLDYTRRALQSLDMSTGNWEWVLIDNGSTDGSADLLREWKSRSAHPVTLITNANDPGGATSRNQGAAGALGRWLLFVDNDILLDDPHWIERLTAVADTHPGVVGASPLLLFPGPDELVQCAGGGATLGGRFGLLARGLPASSIASGSRDQVWAPTAALLVRRNAFGRGFDGTFDPVSVCEDVDLCCRLRSEGGRLLFVPSVRLRHYEGTTFNGLAYDKAYYWRKHARVIRHRWASVFAAGPAHGDTDIEWRPVVKDYADLDRPRVRLAVEGVDDTSVLSFFSRERTIEKAVTPEPRLAVIGCGQVAQRGALPGLSPPDSPLAAQAAPFLAFNGCAGVRLNAVCDVDQRLAEQVSHQFGVPFTETCAARLLSSIPLEGVVICTPPHWHAALAKVALGCGVGVLLEKPGSLNHSELEVLLDAAKSAPALACQLNLPWAYHPAAVATASYVRGRMLGEIERTHIAFVHSGPEGWAPNAAWYRELGPAAVVLDLAPHVAMLATQVFGETQDPEFVGVTQSSWERSVAHLRFGTFEVEVVVGWDAPGPAFVLHLAGDTAEMDVSLVGDRSKAMSLKGPAELSHLVHGRSYAGADEGGPYRDFVARLGGQSRGRTDVREIEGVLRAVMDWSQAHAERMRS